MSTRNEVRGALYSRILTVFAPAASLTADQITFDNEDFDVPSNANWVRVAFRESIRTQETLNDPGQRDFQSRARLICQVFVPASTGGMAASDSIVQALRNSFEGTRVPGFDIYIFGVDVRELGTQDDYDQTNVEINFVYREKR